MRLILASKSPRRAEILRQVGLKFEIVKSSADESLPENISPGDAVLLLSARKADDVSAKLTYAFTGINDDATDPDNIPDNITVIAADTLVVLDGKFLGKPKSEEDAFDMLSALCGRCHFVYTGVAFASPNETGKVSNYDCDKTFYSFYEVTVVHMRNYSDEEIHAYIKTGEPFDKAGGYAIQGRGATLVEKINGDYFNVVGLPIAKVVKFLNDTFKEETY